MTEVYGEDICGKSFKEMKAFVRYANSKGEKPMLFGGWAVYHYNAYAGSRDVDFVVSDENFDAMVDFLAAKGYGQREARLYKDGIFFDLYKKSEDIGDEGRKTKFALLYGKAEGVYLKKYHSSAGEGEVLLPTKPVLLYFKANALVSRNVPKDRSDFIAVLLKTGDTGLEELRGMLGQEAKNRLIVLRNDGQSLSLAAKPTKKNINTLNNKIKFLVS